jgi:ATP-dependent Clp protease ATP-binding subunit ClpC
MKKDVSKAMNQFFKPEFINRIDEIVIFRHLAHAQMEQIVRLHVGLLAKRMSERGIDLILDDSAVEFLVEKGTNLEMGARPLQRAIQVYVEDILADYVISSDAAPAQLLLRGGDESLVLEVKHCVV